jgi:hypothetical protein
LLAGGVMFQAASPGCAELIAPLVANAVVQIGLSALLGGLTT